MQSEIQEMFGRFPLPSISVLAAKSDGGAPARQETRKQRTRRRRARGKRSQGRTRWQNRSILALPRQTAPRLDSMATSPRLKCQIRSEARKVGVEPSQPSRRGSLPKNENGRAVQGPVLPVFRGCLRQGWGEEKRTHPPFRKVYSEGAVMRTRRSRLPPFRRE